MIDVIAHKEPVIRELGKILDDENLKLCLSISSGVHAVDIIHTYVTGDFPENRRPFRSL